MRGDMKKYSGKPVGFGQVDLKDGFWHTQQELVREVTIDAVYDRFEETGRFEALKGEWKEGMPFKPHIFWDSDVNKWMEGAAYYLRKKPDAALEEKLDMLVERMEKLQTEDGYLNSYFTTVEPEARFTRRLDHELYCAGHLIEGALAYYAATGKRKMLDLTIRYIDQIDRIFRIEHSAAFDTPGHQEIEMALVKLYQFTGEIRYKELAEYFVDMRGCSRKDEENTREDPVSFQSHLPVRKQKTAQGHAVRMLYQLCAMADLALLNQEEEMTEACETLFDNIVQRRMHITGGVGSTYLAEAFTFDYDLPEFTTYNETCASIALAMFCRRMWLIEADRKYADCAELALYNTVLSGMSLSGDRFFYENPLAADPKRNQFNQSRKENIREHLPILERVKVFDCSCCPPNLVRTMGAIGDYMYSVSENTVYAHCYMDAEAKICLQDGEICLRQRTQYPYDGKIDLETGTAGDYTIALRIPGWCSSYRILVNGEPAVYTLEKGYACLRRVWQEKDHVVLDLAMPVELVEANPSVSNLCGRVAVMRGPITFCAEGIDNQALSVRDIRIRNASDFAVSMEEICGRKMPVLSGRASVRKEFEALYRTYRGEEKNVSWKLIPYFAWANRGVSEMNVWFLKA